MRFENFTFDRRKDDYLPFLFLQMMFTSDGKEKEARKDDWVTELKSACTRENVVIRLIEQEARARRPPMLSGHERSMHERRINPRP